MMKEINVQCPHCGTANFIRIPEGEHHIVVCGRRKNRPFGVTVPCGSAFAVKIARRPVITTYELKRAFRSTQMDAEDVL
jgi:hypothetical protein